MKLHVLIYSFAIMLSLSLYNNGNTGCSNSSNHEGKKEKDSKQIHSKQSNQELQQPEQDKICTEKDSKKLAKINVDVKKKSDSIHINTPKEGRFLAIVERYNVNVNNTITVRAKIENYPKGILIMSTTDGITEGFIEIPEENLKYSIKTDPDSEITYLMEFVEPDVILTDSVLIPPEKP